MQIIPTLAKSLERILYIDGLKCRVSFPSALVVNCFNKGEARIDLPEIYLSLG